MTTPEENKAAAIAKITFTDSTTQEIYISELPFTNVPGTILFKIHGGETVLFISLYNVKSVDITNL